MKADLYWVLSNIEQDKGFRETIEYSGLYRGFTAVEILKMSEVDFNVFFPEKKIQEEREQKLNKIL